MKKEKKEQNLSPLPNHQKKALTVMESLFSCKFADQMCNFKIYDVLSIWEKKKNASSGNVKCLSSEF